MLPKFKYFFRPVLESLSDNKPHQKADIINVVIRVLNISNEDTKETTKSGLNKIYDRSTWACVYLVKAGMIIRARKGWYQITKLGLEIFEKEKIIDNKVIAKYSVGFSSYQYIAGQTKRSD